MTVILASSNSRSLFTDLLQGTGRLEVILDRSISASAVYNSSNRRGVVPSFYSHLHENSAVNLVPGGHHPGQGAVRCGQHLDPTERIDHPRDYLRQLGLARPKPYFGRPGASCLRQPNRRHGQARRFLTLGGVIPVSKDSP